MKSVAFSIQRVNRLRRAAVGARAVSPDDSDLPPVENPSDGWSASAYRADELLRVFDALWLKPGFALHSHVFRAGGNGNGIIWTWRGPVPRTWKPTYADEGTTREVVLHIHNPIGREEIYRATDISPVGSYDGETETTVLCTGDRFIVY